jgi:hypothetical protein
MKSTKGTTGSKAARSTSKATSKAVAEVLTTAARVAAISQLASEAISSHHKPKDLIRVSKGQYTTEVGGRAVTISQGKDGWTASNHKAGSFSTRAEAYLAAHKVKVQA